MAPKTDECRDALAWRLRAFMHERQFEACDKAPDVAAFHKLAQRLIAAPIAGEATMALVQDKTRSCLYLRKHRGAEDAFLAIFAFSRAGEDAVREGRFTSLCVEPCWVEPPSNATRLGYVWGFGASSRAGRFGVIRALRDMRSSLFAHVALMARAASEDGRALMAPFGLEPSNGAFYGAAQIAPLSPMLEGAR